MRFDLHIADILSGRLLRAAPPPTLLHVSHCKSNERRFFHVLVTVMELILSALFVSLSF